MKLFGQLFTALSLSLFALGSSAPAGEHIKDNLGLFSDKAMQMANQQIAQVYKNHHWMIAVETRDASQIAGLPADKADLDQFLTRWTTKNYEENRLEGIYLVIFKNPAKFRFHVDTQQQAKMGVTKADINSWSNMLGENLRERKFDLALTSVVGNISSKLSRPSAANAPVPPAPKPAEEPVAHDPRAAANQGSSMMTWLLVGGGVFILFLILRSILRGMNNQGYTGGPNQYDPGGANMGGPSMGQPGYGPGYGAPSRGGGFMSGMLGGLFGGMAGNWMYDQMSGRRDSPSESGQGHFTSHDGSRDNSGSSLDHSSSSGESDSTTYGGDWGSSDSGGGDWGGDSGGGDSGGGGDW
jgi:hypothetical protein